MPRAIILGCSHAAGAEMFKDPSITFTDDSRYTFGYRNSYPVIIAKQLGYQPENYAVSGGSNDAMFRIFTQQLNSLTSQDIVIACWTGIDRTEIWHDLDQCWLPLGIGQHEFYPVCDDPHALSGRPHSGQISAVDQYQNYLDSWVRLNVNETSSKLNKIKNILALNTLAQQHSVPVININSFYPVDQTDQIVWAINDTFWDWSASRKFPRTAWGHYFLHAHQQFAHAVVSNLTTDPNTV
jgi:hypothetical protein